MRKALLFLLLSPLALGQCPNTWTCAIVVTQVSSTSVTITWNSAAASSTRIRYGLTTNYGSFSVLNTTPVQTHSATLTNLSTGSLYHFEAIAKDSQGIQVFSVDGTFTAGQGAPHTVALNWTASTSPNVAGYNMYRSTDQVSWTVINTGLIPSTSFTDSNVASGNTYYYGATAVDSLSNESVKSNIAMAVVN